MSTRSQPCIESDLHQTQYHADIDPTTPRGRTKVVKEIHFSKKSKLPCSQSSISSRHVEVLAPMSRADIQSPTSRSTFVTWSQPSHHTWATATNELSINLFDKNDPSSSFILTVSIFTPHAYRIFSNHQCLLNGSNSRPTTKESVLK